MRTDSKSGCNDPHCDCSSNKNRAGWNRRQFLKAAGLGVGLVAASPWEAMAGPFTRKDFERLVPADKKLRPEWVSSLTERGEPAVYRGADLDKIGMPIGGLCAGQLYLGGDGRLWCWDIFNQHVSTGAEHYAKPLVPSPVLEQGFGIRISGGPLRPLDRDHWRDTSFTGQYPIGYVSYNDPDVPVTVNLQAFSPFIPLNTEDSSLPATIFEFTLSNPSAKRVDVEISGWLENAVCLHSSRTRAGLRENRVLRSNGLVCLHCSADDAPAPSNDQARPDIVFDDFESGTYGNWTVEGKAFGNGPVEIARIPAYQGDVGGQGRRVVNSHASAPGETVEQRDFATGKLTSRPFAIERHYINFLIGGGAHQGRTCMNLVVENRVVASATGKNDNHMGPVTWDVRQWDGKRGLLQIVDEETGPWGNIGVDDIVFSDSARRPSGPLSDEPDFGTMALALLRPGHADSARACNSEHDDRGNTHGPVTKPFDQKLVGSVSKKVVLGPKASATASFIVAWHFPNLKMSRLPAGRHYATRFGSAADVVSHVSKNFGRLSGQTRLWHDTWYDSSLPFWFLDRTFLNTSILATSTTYRFSDGRFYGWEGVGCCEGTCGHVWQYAHAAARLFPDLERMTREKVDFGLALQPDGSIHFRGEFNDFPAIDAQAGAILRALREHQMSANAAFLMRTWPKIKRATEWLIRKDGNGDGLIEGNQHNTLDTDWFGPVAWLSGLYLAALLAAETMAREVGDSAFASTCNQIFEGGRKNLTAQLFDGEYFINKPDPAHLDAINSGTGCEIDQVFGQSWAFQVGLGRVFPVAQTVSALRSLYRYNFTPDVGPYRKQYAPGRWYAMPGEAGLLMCTFPRVDWDYAQAKGKGPDWAAGYFNECMNGFEYQAAGHMIWEGLVTQGLAVTRAVHDRYHPSRRNPWNEVECGDHYARSMASYGVFVAACGFEYHGPNGHLGFAPRVFQNGSNPGDFKAAFTTAEGWGTFSQKAAANSMSCRIALKSGKLLVRTLSLDVPEGVSIGRAEVRVQGKRLETQVQQTGRRVMLSFEKQVSVRANQDIVMRLG